MITNTTKTINVSKSFFQYFVVAFNVVLKKCIKFFTEAN